MVGQRRGVNGEGQIQTVMFQRACTMAMRRALPSCFCASPGPFNEGILRELLVTLLRKLTAGVSAG
jgi:hypothetical protein